MEEQIHHCLDKSFGYYRRLSSEKKAVFVKRTKKFIAVKTFETRNDLVLTDEMKIQISACAIQLTFGLNYYLLKHFHKIIIYPDKYYSRMTKSRNVGEVNTAGIIVLSWDAFQKGLADDDDSYNVGLHELAHALNFTDLMGKDIDKRFSIYFDKWYVHAKLHIESHRGEKSFFRN